MKVAFVGNPTGAWYQRKVLQALGRSNITLTISSVAAGTFGVGGDVAGFRSSFHIPVCSKRSDSRTGWIFFSPNILII